MGDRGLAAQALLHLGWQALAAGDVEQAEIRGLASVDRFRALHPDGAPVASHAHLLLAEVAQRRGEAEPAAARYAEALRLARRGGGLAELGRVLRRLGHHALRQGNPPRAAVLLREALARLRDGGALHNTLPCLVGLAGVAAAQRRGERAARLCGAATAALGARFGRQQPLDAGDRADFARLVASVRETLSDPACRAAWAEGQALPLERAIEEALADDASPAPLHAGHAAGGPLSPREREVAALVAGGLSNREIATRLVITERTAEGHVAHILDRLGFRTRVQIAAWATERGLRRAVEGGGSGGPT